MRSEALKRAQKKGKAALKRACRKYYLKHRETFGNGDSTS